MGAFFEKAPTSLPHERNVGPASGADGVIYRIARTFPRDNTPGAGVLTFRLCQSDQISCTLFLKAAEGKLPDLPGSTSVIQVRYSDLAFESNRVQVIKGALIVASKLYGELVMTVYCLAHMVKNRRRPSLIHVHSANYMFTGLALKFFFGIPCVINLYGTDWRRIRVVYVLQKLLGRMDAIFVVARSIERELRKKLPAAQVFWYGNGVDMNVFFPSRQLGSNQIVAVGNLRWQKGYDYLLSAFKSVSDRFPDYSLIIVGEGPERGSLEAQAAHLGLSQKVSLCGTKDSHAVAEILRRSEVFVLSSVSEGFPKALLEALACGLPTVATDVGDVREVGGKGIICVPPRDVDALAEGIIRIIADPNLKAHLSRVAVSNVADYGWDNVIDRIRAGYIAVSEGSNRGMG